jgi:hypothetical protein
LKPEHCFLYQCKCCCVLQNLQFLFAMLTEEVEQIELKAAEIYVNL